MPQQDSPAVPLLSTRIPSAATTRAVIALAVTTLTTISLAAWQLPVSAPLAGQVRVSTRNATNRIWFQTATLMPNRPEAAAPGAHLEVVAANGVTLREFIGFAYMGTNGALTRTQVVGGPAWVDTQRFDVIVPTPDNSPSGLTRDSDQIATGGPAIPLMRQLLADRFHLQMHVEQRRLPALDMVKAGAAPGPDLKASAAVCDPKDTTERCDFRSGPGFITTRGTTMRFLAMQLSWNFPALTLPVRDKSGLTGRYDYTLSYIPALLVAPNPNDPNVPNPAVGTGASLQQALEQRLGLKLVETTDTFDVVVIDSVQPLQ